MKHTLPWNVTGIPPEARELARSAAARDGLSVGDWLTRRIYAEATYDARDTHVEPVAVKPQAGNYRAGNYRDDRDDEARRDRDALVHRLARTEAETESAFRRIDDTLRALARRLETTERSHNEAKISVHSATTEFNSVTREQAQNFAVLARRLDSVERAADTGALRNAIRGLHQGVSRLAEQVAKTANDSSTRIEAFARNIETVSETAQTAISDSARIEKDIGDRLNALTEKLAHSEEMLGGLEGRVQEAMGSHVASVETRFVTIDQRLDHAEQSRSEEKSAFETAVKALKDRLDAAEKHSQEALSEYRLSLEQMRRRLDFMDGSPPGFSPQEIAPGANDFHDFPVTGEVGARVAGRAEASPGRNEQGAGDDSSFDLPPFPDSDPFPGAAEAGEFSPELVSDYSYPGEADAFKPHPSETDDDFLPGRNSPDQQYRDQKSPEPFEVAQDNLLAARRAAQSAAEAEPRGARIGLSSARATGTRSTRERDRNSLRRPLLAVSAALLLLIGVGYLIVTSGISPFDFESVPSQAALPQAVANASETELAVLPPAQGPYSAPAVSPDSVSTTTDLPAGALTTLPSAINQAPTYSLNIDQYASLDTPAPPTLAIASPAPEVPAAVAMPAPSAPAPSTPPSTPAQAADTAGDQDSSGPAVSGPELQATQAAGGNSPSPLDRLLSQARAGSPAAALLVGLKYIDGDGVAVSESEGVRWLRTAAELGEPVAQYRLGSIFERGRGVAADASQAAFWYEQAARGNRKAMHNLAVAYADGLGIEKNLGEAARWFRSAADLGLTDSQFNLAVLYERCMGVPSALNEAYKWYFIAAAQGDTEARSRVEVLATQLPEEQRLTAERAAMAFTPKPLDEAANEPPTLAQIQ